MHQLGATIAQIASDLGIGHSMLERWRREMAGRASRPFQARAAHVMGNSLASERGTSDSGWSGIS